MGAAASCQPCGGMDQACCAAAAGGGGATCDTGLACTFGGGADAGFGQRCTPCGGSGQACCGAGPIAMRTCNTGLTCGAPDGGGGATCQ
jgi:hypothetical protein